ncbi:protein translocase subunit SecD [bacterium]|nr:protein translocase subunit SecD [bacterium]NIN92437.1 protein translocase subunit SecD [bacterium]NIO18551.1 protein translocase subunit SecD [bacterium]NIO73547.1 protein translocase subunit SecD [bacterium]
MQKSIQWKAIITAVIVILAVAYLYPTYQWYRKSPEEKVKLEESKDKILGKILKLGLDLKGGMHLVLEVDLNRLPEGTSPSDAMERALEVIRNRVDQFGVAEPLITRQGDRWVVVELPGVKDPERAIELIGKTALLEFKLVNDGVRISEILDSEGKVDPGKVPAGYEVLPGREETLFLLKEESEITGAALTNAKVKIGGQYNMPYVAVDFNKEGAREFARITEVNIERNLAIVLDGRVQSAPVIKSKIPDGHAIIEGNFTMEKAKDLALVLRAGALPAPVNIIENRTIGPSLGRDSIRAGVLAAMIGLICVMCFMVIYYKLSGLIANLAIILNLIILLGMMAYLGRTFVRATLTLPGIAGIILIIGMSVDANVLIFERIREELRAGKTVRVAIDAGYQKAFRTILDSNITTLIAAAFLFQFGSGPVKGFAVTLSLGILISMFTAIVVTHMIFDMVLMGKRIEKLSI